MRVFRLLIVSLLFVFSACSDELDPASRIVELRLLAVQADTPFALPGSTVSLTALAVDPANRPLTWAWGTCLDEQSSLALECLRRTSFDSLVIGRDLTQFTVHVPETEAPALGVVVVVCPGSIVAGSEEGIPLSCVDDGGNALPFSDFEVGLKRIYTRDPSLNKNPSIAGLSWDGAPWAEGVVQQAVCKTSKAGACDEYVEYELSVSAPDAAEQSVDGEGAAVTEQAVVQYYATAGKLEDGARVYDDARDKWHPRPEDRGQLVTFWFVLRDNRGGVSWTSRQVQVAAQ